MEEDSPVTFLMVGPVAVLIGYLLLRYWVRIDKFMRPLLLLNPTGRDYLPLLLWTFGGTAIVAGIGLVLVALTRLVVT